MTQSSTVIQKKAVGKIVAEALRSVPGCIKHSSGLDRFTGRELPRFDIDLDEDNTACAVEVHIAVRWPSPVTAVAVTVREVVAGWIEAATNIPVVSVAVTVVDVVPSPHEQPMQRITAEDLDATPRTPTFTPITATPITGAPIEIRRTYPAAIKPQTQVSQPLSEITVEHNNLMPIDSGTLTSPWSPETTESIDITHVSSDVPDRTLMPIVTERTQVQQQITPTPLTPTRVPQRPSPAGRVTHISTDVPDPVLLPVKVNHRPRTELYTPEPIKPQFSPRTRRTQVIHLADNIAPQRVTTPIRVHRRPVRQPIAQSLKPSVPSVNRRQVRQPSAQPLQSRQVTTSHTEVTRPITVNRRELAPITVDRQPIKYLAKEGEQ